jgi:ribosomal protein S18 acetylase RimI-like enzyme
MDGFTLRSGRVEDIDAVLGLWRRAGATVGHTDNAESLEMLIQGWPDALIVALDGREIVGSIIACFDGWRAWVYRLVVHPLYRRKGLGTALVAEGERRLQALGAKRVNALVEGDQELATAFWDASPYVHHLAMRRYYRILDE